MGQRHPLRPVPARSRPCPLRRGPYVVFQQQSGRYPYIEKSSFLSLPPANPQRALIRFVPHPCQNMTNHLFINPALPGNRPHALPVLDSCNNGSVPVYPRVCGGTYNNVSGEIEVTGLSPRVRGNPSPPLTPHGSIPACAGEPPRLNRRSDWRHRVYPRVCLRSWSPIGGLSPRVRGGNPRQGNPPGPLSISGEP